MKFSPRKQMIVAAKSLTWLLITLSSLSLAPFVWSQDSEQIKRGEYLARAGLCIDCHTDYKKKGVELAGGAAIKTPFGIIYSTNITPDRETGIGDWTDTDFLRAMHQGIGRDGEHLFPAFPYTTFTHMTDDDVLAIKAYLFSLRPVRQRNKPPELGPPFSWRFLLAGWNWMYFRAGRFTPDPKKSSQWNRGAYLVEAVAHCGECHTPRNLAGGLNRSLYMAGTEDGPEGETTPNITPHPGTGLGDWSVKDIAYLLEEGIKPDGDDVQGLMEDAIAHGYKYMTAEDRAAIAEYIRSLPPIEHRVEE